MHFQVLLGYLSRSPDEWDQLLARRRTEYHVFCDVSGTPSVFCLSLSGTA